MRLHLTDRRPCHLERGDLRRVPQNLRSGIVGYHVCCPRCGFVTVAINGSDGLVITEAEENGSLLVTFSRPVRCTYCAVLIHLDRGEATLEEDANVRQVRYR
jgi:hypothetical protein